MHGSNERWTERKSSASAHRTLGRANAVGCADGPAARQSTSDAHLCTCGWVRVSHYRSVGVYESSVVVRLIRRQESDRNLGDFCLLHSLDHEIMSDERTVGGTKRKSPQPTRRRRQWSTRDRCWSWVLTKCGQSGRLNWAEVSWRDDDSDDCDDDDDGDAGETKKKKKKKKDSRTLVDLLFCKQTSKLDSDRPW